MALHCDFVFTTIDTKFGDTHAKFGLRPTWGMSQTLSQAIGVRMAKELSFSARIVSGEEAVKIGIANAAVFPVPVCALPKTSWFLSMSGIAFSCIEVGWV